nr:hypothetical protein [Tanacetum cinerariifolium]
FADHAGNAAGSVYDAAAEFSMMGISPKVTFGSKSNTSSINTSESNDFVSCDNSDKSSESETYDFASCVSSPKTNDSFSTVDVKISPKNFPSVVLNATSVPAGSRNSSTSISAGRSISAASRNRPASIHADRHIPASRFNKPAPFPAGRSVHPHVNKDIGIIDSGCSRSMTGNKEKLDDFVQVKGGTITFGGGDGKITGKGTIRNFKLNFENVYYVEELQHFNLFSVSKICDKKNKVLFTDDECLVLTKEFQLPDESQDFIALIENQLNKKVKAIRCDNETEFRNAKLTGLCRKKGIKRDYSNARTPQQNEVAERKNRTLMEAARSMLADSKLPTMFWTEAVSTAWKANEGFLVGYAANSKAVLEKFQQSSNIFVLAANYAPFSLSSQNTPELLHLSTLKQLSTK